MLHVSVPRSIHKCDTGIEREKWVRPKPAKCVKATARWTDMGDSRPNTAVVDRTGRPVNPGSVTINAILHKMEIYLLIDEHYQKI